MPASGPPGGTSFLESYSVSFDPNNTLNTQSQTVTGDTSGKDPVYDLEEEYQEPEGSRSLNPQKKKVSGEEPVRKNQRYTIESGEVDDYFRLKEIYSNTIQREVRSK